jgi:hypothetical protein
VWFPSYGWVTFDPTPGGAGSTTQATAWFWPGRFMFDAVQHRWNKWVLDYNVETQGSLLDRLRRWSQEEAVQPLRSPGRRGSRLWWSVAAALAVLASAAWAFARRGVARPVETRAYLRLIELCRRAGVIGDDAVAPLELVEELERRGHPAAGPARLVVEPYLRARFGAMPLDEGDRRAMRDALGAARGFLRPA